MKKQTKLSVRDLKARKDIKGGSTGKNQQTSTNKNQQTSVGGSLLTNVGNKNQT